MKSNVHTDAAHGEALTDSGIWSRPPAPPPSRVRRAPLVMWRELLEWVAALGVLAALSLGALAVLSLVTESVVDLAAPRSGVRASASD